MAVPVAASLLYPDNSEVPLYIRKRIVYKHLASFLIVKKGAYIFR